MKQKIKRSEIRLRRTKTLLAAAVLTLNFTLQTLNCFAQCPAFVNPSFENGGTSCFGCVPPSWTECVPDPDVSAAVSPPNGATAIGFGSYYTASPNIDESFGQTLSTPLAIGGSYSFQMAMENGGFGNTKGVLEIWGGSTACAKSQLLWSGPVTNYPWAYFTVTFAAPTSAWSNITFQMTCPTCISLTEAAYVYIDDLCGISLPITLLSFTGNCNTPSSSPKGGEQVKLQWTTASEINNDYFTIERSSSPSGGGWEGVGTVKGAGNSSTTRSYEFTDNLPLPFGEDLGGVVYYRLKQTDYDGKTETFNSNQVAVDVTECAVQVFPNPAGNTLHVPYSAEQDGEVVLQVYDVIGKLVKEKLVATVKGNNKFTLDLTTVAQGMYVLRVKGTAKESNQKFVKE